MPIEIGLARWLGCTAHVGTIDHLGCRGASRVIGAEIAARAAPDG